MIQNFIQEQVDILARALQRSVAIDDVGINLVAVSKHFNDADDARVRAILARTLEEDSCRYLFSFGIETTREKIVRIAACRELGFKERSCYPIRWQERTLGYLWLVGKVTPAEDKAAVACAGELAVPMFSMQLEDEQAFSKHELVVRDLLSVDTRRASRATTILSRQGRIRADRTYRVLSAAIRKRTGNLHDELHFLRKQFREFTAAHGEATSPLFTDFSPELVIVIPAGSSLSDPDTLMSIACSGVNSNLRIGIGPETDVLHLYDSYAQASSVLQVLRAIPNLGPCSTWEGLGVYGNLALLTRNQEDTQFPLTPGIAALREEDPTLFETLERFLDNAGNIAKTSGELCIHRSTLYYRLKRITDITGTDLNSGLDRFTLHLEFKLFRITSAFLGDGEPSPA
uniref:PucR family transcriptional regulator n=1 Tax=uncultured Bilophila sp. TaxID=529385 RepID=UPI0025E63FBC|nr:helix-turn-helix domain-containing protein [uncultured Bilophila sp.]